MMKMVQTRNPVGHYGLADENADTPPRKPFYDRASPLNVSDLSPN